MRLIDVAKLVVDNGMVASVDLLKRGELTTPQLWTALRGAKKYLTAVATGDLADHATRRKRAAICEQCPSLTRRLNVVDSKHANYCGPAFEESEITCGCLVGVTIDGEPMGAGGKTIVASESCPQAKW